MIRLALTALLALAPALPAAADAPPLRFRGTVEARDGDALTIRRASGSTVTMRMEPRTRVFAALRMRLRDIKPESYLNVVSAADSDRAERVTLFSPSERGFEAGRQPWDTAPDAVLTGGWVSGLDHDGSLRITLAYDGRESVFEVAPGTPVTQVSPGEKALLVPGAAVTAFTQAEPDGALRAGTVIVGRQDSVPTL